MTTILRAAHPAGRSLSVRRMGALAKPGALDRTAQDVRDRLHAACGPTVVGHIFVACWPPSLAHTQVDASTDDLHERALTHALLEDYPTWFFVVGTAHQLWPQLHGDLS